jgi:imidazolonepropionase-like amidohydrolase
MQGDAVNAHFIAFSQRVQSVMVEEAHNAGLTMQSHTMSIESTDMSIEAGVDILTHGDISGLSTPYPEETIEKIVERGVAVGVLPVTQGNLEARQANKPGIFTEFVTVAKENRKNLIKAGALLQVGTECGALTKEEAETPNPFEDHTVEPSLHYKIGEAHFNAYLALEQEGMSGMDILKSATSNPARAYKLDDVGSLETGKKADAIILDADPLESAANYRQIHAVIKGGEPVDRDALPLNPIITA